jgi:hypothetical protein
LVIFFLQKKDTSPLDILKQYGAVGLVMVRASWPGHPRKSKKKKKNSAGGGQVVKGWNQEICSFFNLRFEPYVYSYNDH